MFNKQKDNKKPFGSKINFKVLLICNSIFSAVILLWGIIGLTCLCFLPFPQRFAPWWMDQQMLDQGQGTFLNIAGSVVIICGTLYIASLITSGIMVYYFFYYNPRHNYDVSFTPNIWRTIGTVIFSICFLVLPFIFNWFFFIPYKYWVKDRLHETQKSKIISRRAIWTTVTTVATLGSAAIIPACLCTAFMPNMSSVPNREKDLEQMYTLSENHPNTMVLYFDRCYGLIFNELLEVDYLMFKDKGTSFIQEFPQFTSYIQSLSQDMVTNLSNPNINGSWFMQPEFKNLPLYDPLYNDYNPDLDMNQWYLNSYKSSFGMLNNYGYNNLNLMNPPYYSPKTWQTNANAYHLQENLEESYKNKSFYPVGYQPNVNEKPKFLSMDATVAIKSDGQSPHSGEEDDARLLQDFCASSNNYSSIAPSTFKDGPYGNNIQLPINGKKLNTDLQIGKTKGSSYLFMQFQTTHERYKWVSNKKWISKNNPGGINYDNVDDGEYKIKGRDPNEFVISMWYALQKMKRIFHYMENLPCHDPSRPWVKNQYENTNIYVISDHGSPIVGKRNYYDDVNNYLLKNKVITKKQVDYLNNTLMHYKEMSFGFWNCTIMRKPALYSNPNWNPNNNTPEKFFNQTDLVTDSDLQPIIEADLQRQIFDMKHPYNSAMTTNENYHFNEKESFYFNKKTNSVYRLTSPNPETQALLDLDCNDNFILDPLNNPKIKLDKRIIPIYYGNWIYDGSDKKYLLYYKYYFDGKYPGGIFNVDNYVKSTVEGLN